jgi:hypothetical protein
MKPREFDDLVRQRFDEGNFEYNPGNWGRLEMQMEGQTKKKSVVIWWLPLMAVAAAITVSMGFATYMEQAAPVFNTHTVPVLASAHDRSSGITSKDIYTNTEEPATTEAPDKTLNEDDNDEKKTATGSASVAAAPALNSDHLMDGMKFDKLARRIKSDVKSLAVQGSLKEEKKVKKFIPSDATRNVYGTFAESETTHRLPAQLSLAGGLNMGSKTSGFTIGATARKMVGAHVFVEGDVALTGASNTQRTAYLNDAGMYASPKLSSAGTRTTTSDGSLSSQAGATSNSVVVADRSFSMYYAQVTPSLGYQFNRRFALGVGPDFQQALSDTRPAPSTMDRNNVQVIPMFDMGVAGKAEWALTDRIRTAFLYREGINNIVTPMNKYVERSYMQIQVKYAVFRNL